VKRPVEDGGPLTFLSLMRADRIPPSRDNAERLRLMRARLVPVVGNGYFNFPARMPGVNYDPDTLDRAMNVEDFERMMRSRNPEVFKVLDRIKR